MDSKQVLNISTFAYYLQFDCQDPGIPEQPVARLLHHVLPPHPLHFRHDHSQHLPGGRGATGHHAGH